MQIFCQGQTFTAEEIPESNQEDLQKAFAFRYEVFVEQMGWDTGELMKKGSERDKYDVHAYHIGVFEESRDIIAYARIIPPTVPFMIEQEFPEALRDSGFEHTNQTAEISRMVSRNHTPTGNKAFGAMLLYKYLFQWAYLHDLDRLYIIVEPKYIRRLSMMGFHATQIGRTLEFEDGAKGVVGVLDPTQTLQSIRTRRPDLYQWMCEADFLTGQLQPDLSYQPLGRSSHPEKLSFTAKVYLPTHPLPLIQNAQDMRE